MDASGRYATGRIYNDEKDPVIWHDGRATRVPLGGDEDMFQAVNTIGDAVGFSSVAGGP